MLNIFRSSIRVLHGTLGCRFVSVKSIADLKLSDKKARRVMDSLNMARANQLLQLPMVTHDLAWTLDQHKNKFGRITLHTTWSKIGDIDLALMKDLCTVLGEYEDAINWSSNTDDEESSKAPQLIKKLEAEYFKVEDAVSKKREVKFQSDGIVDDGMSQRDLQYRSDEKVKDSVSPKREPLYRSEQPTVETDMKPFKNIKTSQEDGNKLVEYSLGLTTIVPSIRTTTLPSSIVAVSIETSCIAWCCMASDLRVHAWELRPIFSTQGGKNTFPQIYDEFSMLYSSMPLLTEPDALYVTEESGSRIPVFRARHEAVFFSIVAERQAAAAAMQDKKPPYSNHVYRLKSSAVVNTFGLEVGGQRVSCNNVILDIKRGKCPPAEGVQIPEALFSPWYRLRRYDQYIAGNALLTALAFYNKLKLSATTEKPLKKKSVEL